MPDAFDQNTFHGLLVRGDLHGAIAYLSGFADQAALYAQYRARFEGPAYLNYEEQGLSPLLNGLLLEYQKYYHEVFYHLQNPEEAAARLHGRLARRLGQPMRQTLDELEDGPVADAFRAGGLHFLGGRSSGCYGPYVWKRERLARYMVELPEGRREYAVKLLGDFVSASWVDYLSFGAVGTAGWSGGDGLIHCVEQAYDLESEGFRVSLLQHEAQHAMDLARWPGMGSGDLEYRAKLVELIYSRERALLARFARQAGQTAATAGGAGNGHAEAAGRILREFEVLLPCPAAGWAALPPSQVQAAAAKLFEASCGEMARRYGPAQKQPANSCTYGNIRKEY